MEVEPPTPRAPAHARITERLSIRLSFGLSFARHRWRARHRGSSGATRANPRNTEDRAVLAAARIPVECGFGPA
jgi:hypothetical protein